MFGLGMGEIIIIAIVALLALGPEKLPEAAKKIGETIRGLRRQTSELRKTIEDDTQLGDAMREIRSALREDPLAPTKPKEKAAATEKIKTPRPKADGPAPEEPPLEEPLVRPVDDAVSVDGAVNDAVDGTVDGAADETAVSETGETAPSEATASEAAETPAQPTNGSSTQPYKLSGYERYIHENGTVAAAEIFGTSLEHAEEALESSLARATFKG